MPDTLRNESSPLGVSESRDFRSYHAFVRACRNFSEGPLVEQMRHQYEAETAGGPAPETPEDAMPVLDDLLEFQLYSWGFRHFQRFKYHRPGFGIFDTVNAERDQVIAALEAAAAAASPEELRLDPALDLPEYYRAVDFHQHTGGVWSDPVDGLVYEFGRRTTNPRHIDPNLIYRLSYSQFPDRAYDRVLDWGTGHGAGLIEWQKLHPESECHGVDLSEPCLKLAHVRAKEHGFKFMLSQQDIEHLDYPDDHFDAIFHLFMFHEIPPVNLKAMLKEVRRVLKPGGLFAGPEFSQVPNDPMRDVVQMSHAWTNNETYALAWYNFDMEAAAKAAGFSKISIAPFKPFAKSPNERGTSTSYWRFYQFEK